MSSKGNSRLNAMRTQLHDNELDSTSTNPYLPKTKEQIETVSFLCGQRLSCWKMEIHCRNEANQGACTIQGP